MTDQVAVIQRAALLKDSGRPRQALALLAPYLAGSPDDPAALRVAGWCHLELDEISTAYERASRLVAVAPDQAAAHLLLAVVHGRLKNTTSSVRAIDTAIRLAPYSSDPYRVAAALAVQSHRASARTEELARRAVALAPHDAVAHRVLGSTLIELRRYDEATTALREAAALDPTDRAVGAELARIDIAKGRSGRAAMGFAAAVRADPRDPIAKHNLRVATWNAFQIAHLVLCMCFLVLGRMLALADRQPTWSLAHLVAPMSVTATLAAWAFRLRMRPSSWRVLLIASRSDRLLAAAMASHVLCLFCLAVAALTPAPVAGPVLTAVTVLLLAGTVLFWIRVSAVRKENRERH